MCMHVKQVKRCVFAFPGKRTQALTGVGGCKREKGPSLQEWPHRDCSAGVLLRGRPDGSAACQTCGDLAAGGAGTLRQPLDIALFVEPRDAGGAAPGADGGGCQVAGAPSVSYQPIRGALACSASAVERRCAQAQALEGLL